MPDIGQVLELASGDVRYRTAALRLQVTRVRLDISQWYRGEWVWCEGQELDATNHSIGWQQALVRVAAIVTPARDARPAGTIGSRKGGSVVTR